MYIFIRLKPTCSSEETAVPGYETSATAKSLQLCPTLCDPTDGSPPGSSIHGTLQAKVLEWGAMLSARGSAQPRNWTQVSHIDRFITIWATREAHAKDRVPLENVSDSMLLMFGSFSRLLFSFLWPWFCFHFSLSFLCLNHSNTTVGKLRYEWYQYPNTQLRFRIISNASWF